MSELTQLLALICEQDPPEVVLSGTPSDSRIEALITLGALAPIGVRRSVTCFACDEPHEVLVEALGGSSYQAFCPDAGLIDIDAKWLTRYAPEFGWITRQIAQGLGAVPRPGPTTTSNSRLISVGRCQIKQHPCLVFLGCRQNHHDVWDVIVNVVRRRQGDLPAILVTTTPVDELPSRPTQRLGIVSLTEILELSPSGATVDSGPILHVLKGGSAPQELLGASFTPTAGFRTAGWRDKAFKFSKKQATVVESLYEKAAWGPPGIHQSELQRVADTNQTMGQVFRRHPAFGSLIQHDGTGHYWLAE